MRLVNQTKNREVAKEVIEAFSLWRRAVGLLGRKSLAENSAMWIRPCNNIHTWFMRFPIDVVFVDENLRVKAVASNVRPFRLKWNFSSSSVFEMNAGRASRVGVEVGDQLHVVN